MRSVSHRLTRSAVSAGGGAVFRPTFFAPLTSSIAPSNGLGAPTFTRATTASIDDWESIIRYPLTGEARFRGARRVRNLVAASESINAWTLVNNATRQSATQFTIVQAGSNIQMPNIAGLNQKGVFVASLLLSVPSGTANVNLRMVDGSDGSDPVTTVVALTTTPTRFSFKADYSASATFSGNLALIVGELSQGTIGAVINVLNYQIEDVTGQSNQNPAEYVSVGVLSSPFQGAGVDGVQYFPYQNGNTVASNVVTAGRGASLASTVLLGYLAEEARTNICLQSQNFTVTWVPSNELSITGLAAAPDGTVTANIIIPAVANTTHGISQSFTKAASALAYAVTLYAKPNGYNFISIRVDDGTTNGAWCAANVSTGSISTAATGIGTPFTALASSITGPFNGYYRLQLQFTTNTTTTLRVFFDGNPAGTQAAASSYAGDGVSGVNMWGAQLEQATFATSYIPTTTTSVPRNADVLTYPTSGNILDARGTAYAEFVLSNIAAIGRIIGDGNGGGTPTPITSSSTNSGVVAFDGITLANGPAGIPATNTVLKGACVWPSSAGKYKVGVNGAFGAEANYGGTFGLASIGIGVGANNPPNGTIRNVKIWTKALTDAQISGL